MALWRSNNAEGGSNGTTVTQGSTGNSGGASGNFWDGVSIPGGTLTFSTDHPADGSLGYKIVRPSVSAFSPRFQWDFANETEFRGSFYVYLPATGFAAWTSSSLRLMMIQTSGGSRLAELNLNATGNLRVINSANSAVATSASALATDTQIRVEFHFLGNGTTGRMETSYFLGSATTAVEALAATTNVNTGTTQAGKAVYGDSTAAVTDGYVWYMDTIALSPVAAAASPRRMPLGA